MKKIILFLPVLLIMTIAGLSISYSKDVDQKELKEIEIISDKELAKLKESYKDYKDTVDLNIFKNIKSTLKREHLSERHFDYILFQIDQVTEMFDKYMFLENKFSKNCKNRLSKENIFYGSLCQTPELIYVISLNDVKFFKDPYQRNMFLKHGMESRIGFILEHILKINLDKGLILSYYTFDKRHNF